MSPGLVSLAVLSAFVTPIGSAGVLVGVQADEPDVRVSIGNAAVTEGHAGVVDATFSVTLDRVSSVPVSVDYATANDSAKAPDDYQSRTGTLVFAPGVTSLPVTVPVNGELVDEKDERFFVKLSEPINAEIGEDRGVGSITDDDGPTISIADVTVTEGNSGTTPARFAVSLSAVSPQPVSAKYATANGTASAPGDYVAESGTVTFSPGARTKTIEVAVNGDLADEGVETFLVGLSDAVDGAIADPQAVGTITNDDAQPALSVNDVSVMEGDAGTAGATFTVTLAPSSEHEVTVDYATSDGTATAPADYVAATGTLKLAPGVTSRTFVVPVKGDTVDETDETFTVTLSKPEHATIADGQGAGTIDDDDGPAISIGDATVVEGNAGTTPASFTVSLSAPSPQSISVEYATADGTATVPADYETVVGTLTFAAGEVAKTVVVPVNGDTTNEANETFLLNLANAVNAAIGDQQALGTVTNDDPLAAPPPPPPPPPPPSPQPPPSPPPPTQPPPAFRPPAQARRARAALFAPPAGARVQPPVLLAWRAVPKARFYNVQLYRKGRKILSLWPYRPRLKLRRQWTHEGRRLRLRPGPYTWLVWPAFGSRARPRFGRVLGKSTFRIV